MASSQRLDALLIGVLLLAFLISMVAGLGVASPPPAPQAAVELQQRPTSAYAWAQLGDKLAGAGDFSPRFDALRAITYQLGPHERELRKAQALMALQHWAALSVAARELAAADIAQALQHEPQVILDAAFLHGREAVPCELPGDAGAAVAPACARLHELRRVCEAQSRAAESQRQCLQDGIATLNSDHAS